MGQFFSEIIICFDGDDSGYKAALRAAENSIVELQPEKKISTPPLLLPPPIITDSRVERDSSGIILSNIKLLNE